MQKYVLLLIAALIGIYSLLEGSVSFAQLGTEPPSYDK